MGAILVTVGDELLIGDTVNTNAAWLGQTFADIGLAVQEVVTVPDELDRIVRAIRDAVDRSTLVVVTGGLGPTHDDLTRDAIARVFDAPLAFDESWFEAVKARFRARGRSIPEANRTQAMVPAGFSILPNDVGTAPGLLATFTRQHGDVDIAVLPGVPVEMRHLVVDRLLPAITNQARQCRFVVHVGTAGIGESHLQELLGDVGAVLQDDVGLAYLPALSGLRLRITATADSVQSAQARAAEVLEYVRGRAGRYIYSTTGESLEAAVGRMLAESGLTVAMAESCTGGRVADRLTDIPGSSRYVIGGVVAYCNSVKADVLGVDSAVLDEFGSVSEPVALQMAEGVRRLVGSDIGLSATGILGPGGGTVDKPVGTAWVGIADESGTRAVLLRLGEGRAENKLRVSTAVLDLLRKHIQ